MASREQRDLASREVWEYELTRQDAEFEQRRWAPNEDLGHYPPALLELVEVQDDV